MKSIIFSLLLVPAFALGAQTSLDQVATALGQGDVSTLSAAFDTEVELSILGDEDSYTAEEATGLVRSFFATNAPTGFSQVHSGSSPGSEAKYCIGDLRTSNGSFRVYVYMDDTGGKKAIQELRFDKE